MDTSKFAELGLNEQILAGVAALGFTDPTPVQAEAIPAVLAGRDVVASAQTGTGKTAAFTLPLLQVIAPLSHQARVEQAAAVLADQAAAEAEKNDGSGDGPAEGGEEGASDDKVLLDEIAPEPTLNVPADGDSAAKPAKRRRRRHHKKAKAAKGEGAESDGKPASDKSSGQDAKPKSDGKPESKDKPKSDKPKADGKPKKKRRRKKNKGGAGKDIAAAIDPNAHPFGPFALVITPTRELAQQIDDVASVVCQQTGQRAVIVMGGTKFDRQIRELQGGCDLLVATPGRLIDLMEHNHVDLSQVKVLVLDEADRMLDMGFWPSVRRIVGACPKDRQTLLFSATIPPSIKGTVDAMLNDPVTVEIARVGETADTVEEHLCPVTQGQKAQLLEALLGYLPKAERVLVFCRTKTRVDDVRRYLAGAGVSVDVMHSDRSQKERERALSKFREGKCQVLVATDVMSRGIDVSGIDAVVNYDVPMDPEDYVHRIGRTGRAGQAGQAFTFVAPDEISPLREIEYFTKQLVPVWDLPEFDYDSGRIVPNASRSTKKSTRTMFSGMRSRGRGIGSGRYGRHY